MENAIENINKQKAVLQNQMKGSRTLLASDNRFVWTLVPLDSSLPEDKVVSEWIRKAGLERD
jgi:hypothetical protein